MFDEKSYSLKMDKAIEVFSKELSSLRTGRANASMLDLIKVDVYGQQMPINQVGSITTPEPRIINIQIWDANNVPLVDAAIKKSDLGLNPQNNGEQLIITVPPLTEERRRDLVKKAKAESENAKIGVRNNRKDALDMVKDLKNDGLSEDHFKNAEIEIQDITNASSKDIDQLFDIKEKDIMTV